MRDDETVLGATLQSGGNIALAAGSGGTGILPVSGSSDTGILPVDGPAAPGNITIASGYLNAAGAVALAATNDITLTTTDENHSELHMVKTTKQNFTYKAGAAMSASHKTDKITQTDTAGTTLAIGSVISADNVAMQSGNHLTIHGSQIVADNDIALRAARDINIIAATNTYHDNHELKKTSTGVVDTNYVSVTFGVRTQTVENDTAIREAASSLVGSIDGRVDIFAGRDANIVGSDLWSQKGFNIDADSINILAGQNTTVNTHTETFRQNGVTVALRGAVADLAMTAYTSVKRATEVKDDRLKGLYAAKAAYAAKDLYGMYKDGSIGQGANFDKDKKKNNPDGFKIAISFGSSYSKNTSTTEITDFIASNLMTEGDMTFNARGAGEGWNSGNINIIGSNLTAQNFSLNAANNINLQSAENTHGMESENKNISGAVGVAFGVGKGGGGFSIFADVSLGKGFERGNGTEHLNSTINVAEKLSIISGGDTTIAGAQVKAGSILADIKGNLTLQSLQDTDAYKSKQEQLSAGASGGTGNFEAHGSYSQSKTSASFASVREQTGIFAGEGGFDINVGGNTSLIGAVIASEAEAILNRLNTQTIDFTDIANHSNYDSKSFSINLSTSGAVSGGMSHQSDSKTGTTKSAIADGDITVRSDYDAAGNRIADSLAGLSRDTATANDGAVENIFNPQKLAEQREMGQVFGEVAFRTAGTIVTAMYEKRLEQIQDDYDNKRITAEEAAQQKNTAYLFYGDNQILNYAMNAVAGAATARVGGGNALAGAAGGAGATFADSSAVDIYGDVQRPGLVSGLVSLAAGVGAGVLAGDGLSGGGSGLDATMFNQNLQKETYAELHKIAQSLPSIFRGKIPKDPNGNDLISPELARDLGAASVAAYYSGSAAPPGMVVEKVLTKKEHDTDGVVFKKDTGEIIVAFRGSASISDWLVTNPINAVGLQAGKYTAAMKLVDDLQTEYENSTIILAGHSLGGGQAALSSAGYDLTAITFNAAGVNPKNYIKGTPPTLNKTTNFSIAGELLTSVQELTPLRNAFGSQVALEITTLPSLYNVLNHGSASLMRSVGAPDLIKVIPPVKTSGTQGK